MTRGAAPMAAAAAASCASWSSSIACADAERIRDDRRSAPSRSENVYAGDRGARVAPDEARRAVRDRAPRRKHAPVHFNHGGVVVDARAAPAVEDDDASGRSARRGRRREPRLVAALGRGEPEEGRDGRHARRAARRRRVGRQAEEPRVQRPADAELVGRTERDVARVPDRIERHPAIPRRQARDKALAPPRRAEARLGGAPLLDPRADGRLRRRDRRAVRGAEERRAERRPPALPATRHHARPDLAAPQRLASLDAHDRPAGHDAQQRRVELRRLPHRRAARIAHEEDVLRRARPLAQRRQFVSVRVVLHVCGHRLRRPLVGARARAPSQHCMPSWLRFLHDEVMEPLYFPQGCHKIVWFGARVWTTRTASSTRALPAS